MRSGWSVLAAAPWRSRPAVSSSVGPSYQGIFLLRRRQVLAVDGADGNEVARLTAPMPSRNARYSFSIASEVVLVVVDQVHLVHAHHHLADAEHRQDVAVAAAVLAHAFLGVDDQHGGLGARRARDHVLQELDVAGRVDDDVVARSRLEEAARGVDGDALVLLVRQRVEQEGVLERLARALALAAAPPRACPAGSESGVGQQAADHRALAVIDVADDHDVHLLAVATGGFVSLSRLEIDDPALTQRRTCADDRDSSHVPFAAQLFEAVLAVLQAARSARRCS